MFCDCLFCGIYCGLGGMRGFEFGCVVALWLVCVLSRLVVMIGCGCGVLVILSSFNYWWFRLW